MFAVWTKPSNRRLAIGSRFESMTSAVSSNVPAEMRPIGAGSMAPAQARVPGPEKGQDRPGIENYRGKPRSS